jgi:hypothetical protein
MLMPEAAMDEDNFLRFAKDKIWPTGEIFRMQAVSVAHTVHDPPDHHFRLRVNRSDAAHVLGTTVLAKSVWHIGYGGSVVQTPFWTFRPPPMPYL